VTLPEPLVRLGARHPLAIASIIVATVIGVGATIATVAAFAAERWWVLDVLTSFRPQFLVLTLIAGVALALLRRPRLAIVMAIACGLNVWQVAPVYTRSQPSVAASSATLSIAHLNLQGHVKDGPALKRWLGTRPADVVVLLDIGGYLADQLIRDPSGYRPVFVQPAPTGSPGSKIIDSSLMVLTTRPDVTAVASTTEGLPRSSVEIAARLGDHPVRLLGLHTTAPTSSARHGRRDTQLDAVAHWLVADPTPSIAFGDFNVTWYSPALRSVLDRTDARSSQLGFGIQATWPVPVRPAGIAIDQSIYTGPLTAITRTRGPSFGSEHRALIVTYAWAA